RNLKTEKLVRRNSSAAKRDDPSGNVDMDFLCLDVELEGADVEIDFIICICRRTIDPTREPGVLKTLREPWAENARQRLRPLSASEGGERLRFADQNVIAVEVGRRGRLADPELRVDSVRRGRRRSGQIIQGRRGAACAGRK